MLRRIKGTVSSAIIISYSSLAIDFSSADVTLLRALVSAAQQDYEHLTSLDETDPVAGSMIDAKFTNTATDRFNVAEEAGFQALKTLSDSSDRALVFEVFEPSVENNGLTNFGQV